MKQIITIAAILFASTSFAQDVPIKDGVITYELTVDSTWHNTATRC